MNNKNKNNQQISPPPPITATSRADIGLGQQAEVQ